MPTLTATTEPPPPWATEMLRRIDELSISVARQFQTTNKQVQRVSRPESQLTAEQVGKRLGVSERQAKGLMLRLFTDTREPERRKPGIERRAYEDEVDVYQRSGAKALRTYQREVGLRT